MRRLRRPLVGVVACLALALLALGALFGHRWLHDARYAAAQAATLLPAGGAIVGAADGTPPPHAPTSLQDLCYQEHCYHPSQSAVPVGAVAKLATYAFADSAIADQARAAGIRTIAYLDLSIQYDPKRDNAPLANDNPATMLQGCDGKTAAVRLGDLDGTLMNLGSPGFQALLKAYLARDVRPHYDILFADDTFAATDWWQAPTNPPCHRDFATERDATFSAWAAAGMPILYNGLGNAPDDGQVNAHSVEGLSGPRVMGAMYEMCFTAQDTHNDNTLDFKRVDGGWRSIANSAIVTLARRKAFFCFSESPADGASDAGRDQRQFVYASYLLLFDPTNSVLEEVFGSRTHVPIFPETTIVALDPAVTTLRDVNDLKTSGGAYARVYRACFWARKAIGSCAAIVNPSSSRSVPNPLPQFHHALILQGGAITDSGKLRIDGTPPTTLAPATGVVVFR